uniref:Uncharacterized protein n=1 Tax=Panagrolaimus sp. JU765 TaxID=591449 RepID=A0AC34QBW6_9BILA
MKFLIIFSFFIVFGLINSERTPVNPFDDADTGSDSGSGSPFDEIATRAPSTIQERQQRIQQKALQELERPQTFPAPRRRVIHRYVDENGYTYTRGGYYRPAIGGALYNIYPILYPKGADYCPQLRGVFRFTCQPSKPLRLDLVEFCKQYAAFCGVINTHRLPGPG